MFTRSANGSTCGLQQHVTGRVCRPEICLLSLLIEDTLFKKLAVPISHSLAQAHGLGHVQIKMLDAASRQPLQLSAPAVLHSARHVDARLLSGVGLDDVRVTCTNMLLCDV